MSSPMYPHWSKDRFSRASSEAMAARLSSMPWRTRPMPRLAARWVTMVESRPVMIASLTPDFASSLRPSPSRLKKALQKSPSGPK